MSKPPFEPNGMFYLVSPVSEKDLPEGDSPILRAGSTQVRSRAYRIEKAGPGSYTQQGALIPLRYAPGDVVSADPAKVNEVFVGQHVYLLVAESFLYGRVLLP